MKYLSRLLPLLLLNWILEQTSGDMIYIPDNLESGYSSYTDKVSGERKQVLILPGQESNLEIKDLESGIRTRIDGTGRAREFDIF